MNYIKQEYDGFKIFVKEHPIRCTRAVIESIIMTTLMVSWVFYVMKPFLDDVNNYGVTTLHPDPIAVLGICGFVFLSFFFLMTWGWNYLHRSLIKSFKKAELKFDDTPPRREARV